MAIGARKAKSGSMDQPAPGTYMARLVGIMDLGHQPGFKGQGFEIDPAYQIRLTYELPTSRTKEDNRPHWVSEEMKNSDFFDKKKGISSKLMKRVYALDPTGEKSRDGKDLVALINVPCMVEVAMKESGYLTIKNVTGAPQGIPVGELENEPQLFDIENPDLEIFARLPDFLKKKLVTNLDFAGSELEKALLLNDMMPEFDEEGKIIDNKQGNDQMDDDVPF